MNSNDDFDPNWLTETLKDSGTSEHQALLVTAAASAFNNVALKLDVSGVDAAYAINTLTSVLFSRALTVLPREMQADGLKAPRESLDETLDKLAVMVAR